MRLLEFIHIVESTEWLNEWQPESGMHVRMITGSLAEKGLRRVMEAIDPEDFTYSIQTLDVAVAAWITTDMIRNQISDLEGTDIVLIPGKTMGDSQSLSAEIDRPVIRGPDCYSELPMFLEVKNWETISPAAEAKPQFSIVCADSQLSNQISRLLSKTYRIPALDYQNLLAYAIDENSKIGELVSAYASRSAVPPNLIASLVNNRVVDEAGYVLTDYPRTSRDLQWIDDLRINLDAIVYIETAAEGNDFSEFRYLLADDPRVIRLTNVDNKPALVAELLTAVEKRLNQCVMKNEGLG